MRPDPKFCIAARLNDNGVLAGLYLARESPLAGGRACPEPPQPDAHYYLLSLLQNRETDYFPHLLFFLSYKPRLARNYAFDNRMGKRLIAHLRVTQLNGAENTRGAVMKPFVRRVMATSTHAPSLAADRVHDKHRWPGIGN